MVYNHLVYTMADASTDAVFHVGTANNVGNIFREENRVRHGYRDTELRKRISEILANNGAIRYNVVADKLTPQNAVKIKREKILIELSN